MILSFWGLIFPEEHCIILTGNYWDEPKIISLIRLVDIFQFFPSLVDIFQLAAKLFESCSRPAD